VTIFWKRREYVPKLIQREGMRKINIAAYCDLKSIIHHINNFMKCQVKEGKQWYCHPLSLMQHIV
jgi:hypothetical protein